MLKVWRWLKRWWWTILVGVGTVAGFLFWLLMPKPKRDSTPGGSPPPRTFKERAKEEVERVRLEGEVEKARVTAKADVQNQQLDDIEVIGREDPVEARRQLASWLTSNL